VTFCNQRATPELSVAVVDCDTGDATWVEGPAEGWGPTGTAGIARTGNGWFVASQAGGLVHLDRSLRATATVPTPGADDVHSIMYSPSDHRVVLASSANDTVFDYHLDDAERSLVTVAPLWHANGAGPPADTVHVNSVAEHDGVLYATVFGPRSTTPYGETPLGALIRLPGGETVIGDLAHPHSLVSTGDALFVIESRRRVLRQLMPIDIDIIELDYGYPRGLALTATHAFVGVSAARRVSKSLGSVNFDPAAVRPDDLRSRLVIVELSTGDVVHEVDLTAFGREVYDIAFVPDDVEPPDAGADALERRVVALEDAYDDVSTDANAGLKQRLRDMLARVRN
jgi:hypothetical protein